MKASYSKFLILLFVLFITNEFSILASTKKDPEICLNVKCEILFHALPISNVEVLVYDKNELIDDILTDSAGFINLQLKRNSQYSFVIKEAGYMKKLVSISTFLPIDNDDYETLHKVNFSVEMRPEIHYAKDHDALDFPYILLSYSRKKKKFLFGYEYTQNIKKELNELEVLVAANTKKHESGGFEVSDTKKIQALIDEK